MLPDQSRSYADYLATRRNRTDRGEKIEDAMGINGQWRWMREHWEHAQQTGPLEGLDATPNACQGYTAQQQDDHQPSPPRKTRHRWLYAYVLLFQKSCPRVSADVADQLGSAWECLTMREAVHFMVHLFSSEKCVKGSFWYIMSGIACHGSFARFSLPPSVHPHEM